MHYYFISFVLFPVRVGRDVKIFDPDIVSAPISDCLEHTGVVSSSEMPHKLVLETLERLHVLALVRDLILDYYSDFSVRVSARSVTTQWHRLEVGIITGCTISVILFVLVMNTLVKSAGQVVKRPQVQFWDDLTVTTKSVPGGR